MDDHPDFPQPAPGTDPCGPPLVPTLVHCIHCGQEYDSYLIKWVVTPNYEGKLWGHWVCPIPGCDGAGFCIDIWPVDPEWRNEHGEKVIHYFEDEDEDEGDEFDDDLGFDPLAGDVAEESIPWDDDELCDSSTSDDTSDDGEDESWSPPTTMN